MALSAYQEIEACVERFHECLDILDLDGMGGEEAAVYLLLQQWLTGLFKLDPQRNVSGSVVANGAALHYAFQRLVSLASDAVQRPAWALGVGQMLHSFFWWGPLSNTRPQGPSIPAVSWALRMHEVALHYRACDSTETPHEDFVRARCPWRWRFVLLLGVEVGRHLAGLRDFANASATLAGSLSYIHAVQRLPFFEEHSVIENPLRLNQNWDFFPGAQHWPIWPREAWPPLGHFLERHYEIFRSALEALLREDSEGERFLAAALHQTNTAPHFSDWSRLKLVHSGGTSELCRLPFMRASCELLAARPEIGPRCRTELSGASLARLMPGAELKPHFGTHPRLTVHLGLRAPSGASMAIAGEEVRWQEGRALVFDDTYPHSVRHRGAEARYVLVAWFCHPCDLRWRGGLDQAWREVHPLPQGCAGGGGELPFPGYGSVP